MESTPQEITTLVGREVYSTNGVYVGEVEDVRLNLDTESVTGMALTSLNSDLIRNYASGSRGIIVPYRWVRAVGDVVLINDVVERLPTAEEEEEATA